MKKDWIAKEAHAKAVAKPKGKGKPQPEVNSGEAVAEPGVQEGSTVPEPEGEAGIKLGPKKTTRSYWFIRTMTYVHEEVN